jgi:hypothetical protein
MVGGSLSFTHARLSGLLTYRLIGKNADPHLSLTAKVASDGYAARLNLLRSDPPSIERLHSIFAKGDKIAPFAIACKTAFLTFTIFSSFGHQRHGSILLKLLALRHGSPTL